MNNIESLILKDLNQDQVKGVKTLGNVLIIAGAGSGKTKTLTRKIAYLIGVKHVSPWKILAISFTNKSSNELKKRLKLQLGHAGDGIWASTFNSLGMQILRRWHKYVGLTKYFTVIGTSSQRTLMKRILTGTLNLNKKQYKPRDVLASISKLKNKGITYQEYKAKHDTKKNNASPYKRIVSLAYENYQKTLIGDNEVDFDNMLLYPVLLFEKYPQILQYYQNRFQHVCVDEYQDTNDIQYKFIKLLNQANNHLTVVGDPDQSIFGFRGANYHIILNFTRDFPNAKVVKLTKDYRSTKNILQASNSLIKNNKDRVPKDAWTDNPRGSKVIYYRASGGHDEANFVINQIKYNKRKYNLSYNDFGILYRTNAQSRVIEESALKNNVPYVIYGGHKFFQRAEIKTIVAYLNTLVNKKDDMSFERAINIPKRGIGDSSYTALVKYASRNHCDILTAIHNIDKIPARMSSRSKNSIKRFGILIDSLRNVVHKLPITKITKKTLVDSGIVAYLKKASHSGSHIQTAKNRLKNLQEFLSLTYEYDTKHHNTPISVRLSNFLADIALLSAQDTSRSNKPQVTMMTVHAAKGLEFPVVFVVGLEQSLFPCQQAIDAKDAGIYGPMEEERRLAYVAYTRAESKLYITNAKERMIYGKRQKNPESEFIHETDSNVISRYNPYEEINTYSDSLDGFSDDF